MKPAFFAPRARRDVLDLARHSEVQFGRDARDRYLALIGQAVLDLRRDPTRPGVQCRAELPPDVRLYHLRHSRSGLAPRERPATARHVMVFRETAERVEIVRVLHDAMDWVRHL